MTLAVVMLGFVYAAIQAVSVSLRSAGPPDRAAELFGLIDRGPIGCGPLLLARPWRCSARRLRCLLPLPLVAGVVLLITVRLPAPYSDADDTRVANSARAA
jgi:hypothetical protein